MIDFYVFIDGNFLMRFPSNTDYAAMRYWLDHLESKGITIWDYENQDISVLTLDEAKKEGFIK